MHIAICDDNIADRKQLERLLKRESDNLKDTREPFYLDGYGNPEAVMHSPMLYEAFFIDMTTSSKNGYEIAMDLIHIGVTVPIILCISDIDYKKFDLPDNCYCLQKPIRVSELTEILEIILKASDNKVPHIEVRTEKETVYVLEHDIMYIVPSGRFIQIHLKEGTVLESAGTVENFYEEIKHIPTLLPVSYQAIVHVSCISQTSFFSVRTKNGRKFFLHPNFRKFVYYMFKEYQRTSTQ